jgi:hypothetical protein
MSSLGVSITFDRERNLEIIADRWVIDPDTTVIQVRNLLRFPKFEHSKGLRYPACQCLGCEGVKIINDMKEAIEEHERSKIHKV